MTYTDGEYAEKVSGDDSADLALMAAGGPMKPPSSWFTNPGFTRPQPIQVTSEGKISGHIAAWDIPHIGLPGDRRAPRSRHDYAFFRTGELETAEGSTVPVGQLTLAGGHATLQATAGQAVKHYDDTATAVADLAAGEDAHGIWVSGAVRPGVTDEQIRALRAAAPSGDWRPINGNLELVAVCQVNTPGFPVARAMVASGEVTALVAAGAYDMYRRRHEYASVEMVDDLANRLTRTEALVAAASRSKVTDEELEELDAQEARAMAARRKMGR